MYEATSPLVTTEWLATHLDAPDVRVVDASWYLPQMQRNAREEYEREHIPDAVFFDIDEIC
ncbi:MAG TPA: 3-mercaptopyruvate sulfurtransferase, partial [Rhodobiaceae bacterium]|nr:3-mercaptopyruvate sulfurtransferase [Rhodobiaceae bacterium]